MKKSITGVVALLAGALAVHSQGTVSFANYGALAPYIYVSLGGVNVGGPATGLGIGNGNDWTVALYGIGGPDEAASSLFPLVNAGGQPVTATLADGDIDDAPGTWYSTETAEVPYTIGSGSSATVQIRAWYNGGGAYTTYNAAVAAGAATGVSATANIITGGPTRGGFVSTAILPSGTGAGQLGNIILSGLLIFDGYGIEVNSNNTVTITGYTGTGGALNIPTNINGYLVTSIAGYAFDEDQGNTSPTSITIPDTVTSIQNAAFQQAYTLTALMIGSGVTNIGSALFLACFELTSITVDSLNPFYCSVNGVLFNNSQTVLIAYPPAGNAGSYTIPGSVTSIGAGAFEYCGSQFSGGLQSVTIPSGLTNIGNYAFYATGLTNVTIPNSVVNMGGFAFYGCGNLTNASIGNSVTSIGDYAFEACPLTSIAIPHSVTNIGMNAFALCGSLSNIVIPGSVTSLGENAFYNCSKLSGIFCEGNAPTADSSAFMYDNAVVYYLPSTTGWSEFSSNTGCSTVLWQPRIELVSTFGAQSNTFGFNVSWADNRSAIVEACTNLANPIWQPLQTNTLNGGSFYFIDPQRTNYPGRFYRVSGQ